MFQRRAILNNQISVIINRRVFSDKANILAWKGDIREELKEQSAASQNETEIQ